MNFIDLLFEDDGINISPFSLFSIGKRSLFNKAKGLKPSARPVKKAIRKAEKNLDIQKEKINAVLRGDSGVGEEGTLYDLTDEQLDVMGYIYKKYGYKIYNEIKKFRKNILAPYEVIKRDIKKNSRITAKEVYGLTKEEFLQAYESGRKKIENRGMKYVNNSKNLREKIQKYNNDIERIKRMRENFEKTGEIDIDVLEKLFNKLGAGLSNFGAKIEGSSEKTYTNAKLNSLERKFDEALERIRKGLSDEQREKLENRIYDIDRSLKTDKEKDRMIAAAKRKDFEQQIENIKKFSDVYMNKKPGSFKTIFADQGFDEVIGLYMFRKNVMDKLKNIAKKNGEESFYYYFYMKVIDELIEKKDLLKMEKVNDLEGLDDDLEFNENEAKIFKLKLTAPEHSSNINDYKQKIKIEDYPDSSYIPVKRSPELNKAIDKMEREIKKFEKKITDLLDDEDVALLKKYRLINNLIKIKELDDPEALFKSPDEIERTFKTISKRESDMEYNIESGEKDTYYMRSIREELDKAKKFKRQKDENRFRAQKTKIRNLIREFRRVDVKANKKLAKFKDEFEALNFSVLTGRSED